MFARRVLRTKVAIETLSKRVLLARPTQATRARQGRPLSAGAIACRSWLLPRHRPGRGWVKMVYGLALLGALLPTIASCTSTPPPEPAAPFDIVSNRNPNPPLAAFEPNGLPLDPVWGAQASDRFGRQRPRPSMCGYDVSQDDPRNWPPDDVDHVAPDLWDAPCTSQPTQQVTHYTCPWHSSNTGAGHANWTAASYDGALTWIDWSGDGVFADDDYTLRIYRPDQAALTSFSDQMGIEFNQDEVLDGPTTSWWQALRDDAQEGYDREHNGQLKDVAYTAAHNAIDGRRAIVVGLLGVDNVEGDITEMHPAWAMAIHEQLPQDTGATHDTWAFFARNFGNEGYCGPEQLQFPNQDMKLFLPAPANAQGFLSGIATITSVGYGDDPYGQIGFDLAPGGVVLTFHFHRQTPPSTNIGLPTAADACGFPSGTFPRPCASWPLNSPANAVFGPPDGTCPDVFKGEITLRWTSAGRTSLPYVAPGDVTEEHDSIAPPTCPSRLLAQMALAQRQLFDSLAPQQKAPPSSLVVASKQIAFGANPPPPPAHQGTFVLPASYPDAAEAAQKALVWKAIATAYGGSFPALVGCPKRILTPGAVPIVAPLSLDFTYPHNGPQNVTITAQGTQPTKVGAATITGPNADAFKLNSTSCDATLQPGQNCKLLVSFAPHTQGPQHASLDIADNGSDSPQHVALSGPGLVG